MEALSSHLGTLRAELASPMPAGGRPALAGAAAPLVAAAIELTDARAWGQALGAEAGAAAAAQVVAAAVRRRLFPRLATILDAACPDAGGAGAPELGEALAGALAASLAERYMAAEQAVHERLGPEASITADRQLASLLCVPLLPARCAALRRPALAPQLWRHAVAALQPLSPAELVAWLPEGLPHGKAGAAAALLGNLLVGAPAVLRVCFPRLPASGVCTPVCTPMPTLTEGPFPLAKQAGQAVRGQALAFLSLATTLLAVLPLGSLYPAARWAGEEEEEEEDGEARLRPAASAAPMPRLPWDAEALPSAALLEQLRGVTDPRLLRALVLPVLPIDSAQAADAAAAAGGSGRAALQSTAADVRTLCGFLAAVAALPGQRQRLLIGLAVAAGLVQRLWFSYLRPAHAAGGDGWLPSRDDSCDPGWMLPLTLFSLTYSSFIVTGRGVALQA